MIDFHVLTHPVYKRTCFEFVHPRCAIHKVAGIAGHIGEGRFQGFSKGTQRYVSFYDDDDFINIKIIDEILKILEEDQTIDAICTDEITVKCGKLRCCWKPIKDKAKLTLGQAQYIHHLVVLRRSSIEPFLHLLRDCPDWAEFTLWVSMIKAGCKFQWMKEVGYTWNLHNENAKSMKIKPTQFSKDCVKEMFSKN